MSDFQELKHSLDRFESNPFAANAGINLILCVGRKLLNFLEVLPENAIIQPEEEPFISVREFCNSLIVEGQMIIFPHNLNGYINSDPDYFGDAFYQKVKAAPFKIRPKKMIEKLRAYKGVSKVLKKYFEQEQKSGCQNP